MDTRTLNVMILFVYRYIDLIRKYTYYIVLLTHLTAVSQVLYKTVRVEIIGSFFMTLIKISAESCYVRWLVSSVRIFIILFCQLFQVNVCDFLRKKIKIINEEALIHSITGVLDVNCHEVKSSLPGVNVGPDTPSVDEIL